VGRRRGLQGDAYDGALEHHVSEIAYYADAWVGLVQPYGVRAPFDHRANPLGRNIA
jgi:hypothetical protein